MKATGFIVATVASIIFFPGSTLAVPCASDYATYREKLIREKWKPVAVKNNVGGFTEVSAGSRIASAKWLNPDRTETIIFVLWWNKMKLCIPPQFSVSPD